MYIFYVYETQIPISRVGSLVDCRGTGLTALSCHSRSDGRCLMGNDAFLLFPLRATEGGFASRGGDNSVRFLFGGVFPTQPLALACVATFHYARTFALGTRLSVERPRCLYDWRGSRLSVVQKN